MKIHFIAIGGAVMHNMAISLSKENIVTGSDDQIRDPSKSRLKKHNLLPKKIGWCKKNITNDLDCVILGMHAKKNNPELIEAKKLKVPIYSFPEYIAMYSRDKIKVVISGSHGKTTITSMIIYVLNSLKISFDYMVGAQLNGFENMFRLTKKNKVIILEGDEYLCSAIDLTPKFHKYMADIGVVSGISWDHINVFKTFESYTQQFEIFMKNVSSSLIYYEGDKNINKIIKKINPEINKIAYNTPKYKIIGNKTFFKNKELKIFGEHNLQNLKAAIEVCKLLKVSEKTFLEKISSFSGAKLRMEVIKETSENIIFRDFAHSPSKLKASVNAVKMQYKKRKLIACIELHTFSSLEKSFLSEYKGCMRNADYSIVYFNPGNIKIKQNSKIKKTDIIIAFKHKKLKVFSKLNDLINYLNEKNTLKTNILMMSSGNFDGLDFERIKIKS